MASIKKNVQPLILGEFRLYHVISIILKKLGNRKNHHYIYPSDKIRTLSL